MDMADIKNKATKKENTNKWANQAIQMSTLSPHHEAEDLPITQTLRSDSDVENEKQHPVFPPESI